MRLTIITDTNHPSELTTVENWFRDFASHIISISENEGCGCCVNIWTVEANPEAFAALPDAVKSDSDGGSLAARPSPSAP